MLFKFRCLVKSRICDVKVMVLQSIIARLQDNTYRAYSKN